jgi:hypothetical protein
MKKKANPHIIRVYLTETDYDLCVKGFKSSTCRSMSAYGAKLLLEKPVETKVRNRSIDDLIELGGKLRRDIKDLLAKDSFSLPEKELLRKQLLSFENNLIQLIQLCSQG